MPVSNCESTNESSQRSQVCENLKACPYLKAEGHPSEVCISNDNFDNYCRIGCFIPNQSFNNQVPYHYCYRAVEWNGFSPTEFPEMRKKYKQFCGKTSKKHLASKKCDVAWGPEWDRCGNSGHDRCTRTITKQCYFKNSNGLQINDYPTSNSTCENDKNVGSKSKKTYNWSSRCCYKGWSSWSDRYCVDKCTWQHHRYCQWKTNSNGAYVTDASRNSCSGPSKEWTKWSHHCGAGCAVRMSDKFWNPSKWFG